MTAVYKLQSVNDSDNSRLSHRLSGRIRRDYYEVEGLSDCDDMDTAFAFGLPKPGMAPYNDDTIIRETTRVAIFGAVAPFTCVYAVDASASYETPQYRRNTSLRQAGTELLEIPNWYIQNTASGDAYARGLPIPFQRRVYVRVDTQVATGVTPEQVADFDSTNAGRWTLLGNTVYEYVATDGTFGADGFSLLRSIFRTTARIRAMPVNIVPGWAVSIPALPNLAQYAPSQANGLAIPVVTPLLFQSTTDQMEPIPWRL